MPQEKSSKTQQSISLKAHQRLEEIAGIVQQYHYDVVAGTLTRIIADTIQTKEELDNLFFQMDKMQKEVSNG